VPLSRLVTSQLPERATVLPCRDICALSARATSSHHRSHEPQQPRVCLSRVCFTRVVSPLDFPHHEILDVADVAGSVERHRAAIARAAQRVTTPPPPAVSSPSREQSARDSSTEVDATETPGVVVDSSVTLEVEADAAGPAAKSAALSEHAAAGGASAQTPDSPRARDSRPRKVTWARTWADFLSLDFSGSSAK
jgi:hypothetical protein